ncbi:MAG: cache domain-containing protein [Marmoricola sp.]
MTTTATTPSTRPADASTRCADAVSTYFTALFASLDAIAAEVVATFGRAEPVTATVLGHALQPVTGAALGAHPIVGGGFVAAPGALADRELFLAWWQGEDRTLLAERGVPIGHHVFDYTRHEWFQVPRTSGRAHVTGPYVDYVCTDEYVLTATAPVVVGGRMVGVVGGDTLLETFEDVMAEPLRGGDAVLVNGHDRCVLAADPLLRSGQRVDVAAYASVRPLPGLPFRVLAEPRG